MNDNTRKLNYFQGKLSDIYLIFVKFKNTGYFLHHSFDKLYPKCVLSIYDDIYYNIL